MTNVTSTFVAALGFLAAGLIGTMPASAGPLTIAKPVAAKPAAVAADSAGLHLIGGGSWREKSKFRDVKKHFRGRDDHRYRGEHFRGHKKKRFKRAYRRGYDEGYYEGRRDRGHYRDYGYRDRGYYDRPRYRRRGHHNHHRGYRGGGGYIKTPGIYFRF